LEVLNRLVEVEHRFSDEHNLDVIKQLDVTLIDLVLKVVLELGTILATGLQKIAEIKNSYMDLFETKYSKRDKKPHL